MIHMRMRENDPFQFPVIDAEFMDLPEEIGTEIDQGIVIDEI